MDFPPQKKVQIFLNQEKCFEKEKNRIPLVYYLYSSSSSFDLHRISSHEYSKLIELNDFLLDLTKYLLRSAKQNERSIDNNSLKETIIEYISNYINGESIFLKSFQLIQATYLNRLCFISHFARLFSLTTENVNFNGTDYFQFLRLICGDFPEELLEKTIRFILKEKVTEDKKLLKVVIPGKLFIKGIFLTTVFREFCEESERILNGNESVQNYSINIMLILENLKEKSILEEFYAPPLGLIYSIILRSAKDIDFKEKVIIFSRKMMGNLKTKGTISVDSLLNDIINDKIFEKIIYEEIGLFWSDVTKKRLDIMENILKRESDEENDEESDQEKKN